MLEIFKANFKKKRDGFSFLNLRNVCEHIYQLWKCFFHNMANAKANTYKLTFSHSCHFYYHLLSKEWGYVKYCSSSYVVKSKNMLSKLSHSTQLLISFGKCWKRVLLFLILSLDKTNVALPVYNPSFKSNLIFIIRINPLNLMLLKHLPFTYHFQRYK